MRGCRNAPSQRSAEPSCGRRGLRTGHRSPAPAALGARGLCSAEHSPGRALGRVSDRCSVCSLQTPKGPWL